ncbi:hypothetical protein NDU88_006620 [Pleurodeles waltl]|uniref:Uncharacterized protein n=1 Tax=Pleurodeles waltl TaxID=8319 RepID=A0AAV7N006_PLEWA|nr:hypothetical protein NDU88_006620 [Pleurodeles waltl]
MAEKETKIGLKGSKTGTPVPDSPIKGKVDITNTVDMMRKKLAKVHDLAKATKSNTDMMQLELCPIRSDINAINNKVADAEPWISMEEDTLAFSNKDIQKLQASSKALQRDMAELEH